VSVRIIQADCMTALPQLAAEGFRAHAVVTDPPYHLTSIVKRFGGENAAPVKVKEFFGEDGESKGSSPYLRSSSGFMGQQWDGGDVAFRPETWRAVFECMLPGAFLVAFASTRGYHRMVCAIEDAGLIIHPMLGWIFGSGFPKATRFQQPELDGWRYGLQALKPALEPICLAQKPLDSTGSQNWAKHGCGGLNIDACRVPTETTLSRNNGARGNAQTYNKGKWQSGTFGSGDAAGGRWPANVVLFDDPEVEEAFAAFAAPGQQGDLKGHDEPRPSKHDNFGEFNGRSRPTTRSVATAAQLLGSSTRPRQTSLRPRRQQTSNREAHLSLPLATCSSYAHPAALCWTRLLARARRA
jgi:site-specific DNA-methyltransferase (adenine-specific)